jgi:hypothetical protein
MDRPPVNEYVDLQIIDCNRQHSVQAQSGNDTNPALFTNELGQGITLNVGDRVAVQGAYISEIGAGADTIELSGRSMDSTKTIKYIEDDINESDNYPVRLGQNGTTLITDTQLLRSQETTDTFIPKDNETKITCEFYKAASGDGSYVFLPRRWAWDNASATQTDEKLVKYLSDNWTKNDIKELGRNYFEPIVRQYYNDDRIVENQFVSDDYIYVDTSTTRETDTGFYRLKQDGSRYTLMRAIDRDFYLRSPYTDLNGSLVAPPIPSYEQPSHFKYRTFRQKIDIKVSEGFNSPENIGKEISATLKKADTPKVFEDNVGTPITRELSVISKSPTYQPFLCGSSSTLSYHAWYNYAQQRSGQNASEEQFFFDYQSNFYNVYCKRPEIREAGEKINDAGTGYTLFYNITKANRETALVYTKIPWTEDNLNNLRDLFKAQKLYPELFSNNNAQIIQPPSLVNGVLTQHSVEDMRYLHMSNDNYGSTLLGDDEEYSLTEPPASRQSLPIFIYFDKTKEDTFTDGLNGTDDMCYGFARKHIDYGDNKSEWIVFTCDRIGGINDSLFTFNNVDITTARRIGYDWSFGAYGSAYMIAYNGRLREDYGNTQVWGVGRENRVAQANIDDQIDYATGETLRLNYVGANNPIMSYDPNESRFFFQDLHTPEVIGQIGYGAGDTATITGIDTIPDNTTDGRQKVYKINKRVTKYTYSPDLRPYDSVFSALYPYPEANFNEDSATAHERKISSMNRNIQPWAIIDTPCGVFINDFGYTKEQFSTGLWGILGWTYESLQSETTGENNRLQRVDNTNRNQLSIPTTNSDIVSSDTRNYIVNQYGAVYYTQQLPTPSIVGGVKTNNHVTAGRQQFTPPITQATTSIGLVAPNLPRKMLKPYYCIRSDIIDKPHYLGGEDNEAKLPVVAVCDKQYSSTDFVFSSESDYVFTITKKKTITSITTSIHDPNQSFSRVNNDSAVIYKISRNITNRLDISQQIMEATQKKK